MDKHYISKSASIALLFTASASSAMDLNTLDIFEMIEKQIAEEKVVQHINCNNGKYELDPKSFAHRYYGRGKSLPININEAMKQANARTNAGEALPADCPIVRTKMTHWNSNIPYSNKFVFHGPAPHGATVEEVRPLKYVYITSDNIEWESRSAELLKAHGKYEVVSTPQEAELFISIQSEGGQTRYGSGGAMGTGVTYISWNGAAMTVRWYKKGAEGTDDVESRTAYWRSQKGNNALEALFKHFLNAVDGPKPKEEKKGKK
jgi:hypothetical protein